MAALTASQGAAPAGQSRDVLQERLSQAQTRLRRLTDAVAAGADAAALVEAINEAQAQREAARAELAAVQPLDVLSEAEVHAMIDSLGDVGAAINETKPERLQGLYEALRLEKTYLHEDDAVHVTVEPARRDSAGVRGGVAH